MSKATPTVGAMWDAVCARVIRYTEQNANHIGPLTHQEVREKWERIHGHQQRWHDWGKRCSAPWSSLTPAAKRAAVALVESGRSLPVGREPGDEVHPRTAARLVRAGLADTTGTNEWGPDGPDVWLFANTEE